MLTLLLGLSWLPVVAQAQPVAPAPAEPPAAIVEAPAETPAPAATAPTPPAPESSAPPAAPAPSSAAAGASTPPAAEEGLLSRVGMVTAGSGLLGALGIAGLAFLSPMCCGLPFGLPCGMAATGAGAAVGAALVSDWDLRRIWFPVVVGSAVGGVAALIGSVGAMAAAAATGMSLNAGTFDVNLANSTTLLSAGVAAAVAGVAMAVGAIGAGAAAAWAYQVSDEEVTRQPARKKKPRAKKRTRQRTTQPRQGGFAY